MASMSTSIPDGADAPSAFPFGDPDPRLEDFLDDKLQAAADLGTVDALLAAAAAQHAQLMAQLDGAAEAVQRARLAAAAERAVLAARLDEFAALEAAVAERLAAVNAADAAPEAVVRRLEGPLAQLQRVTLAHDYLELVGEVATLAGGARKALRGGDDDDDDDPYTKLVAASEALPSYARLRQLAARVEALRPAADMAAAHLAGHVQAVAAGVGADVAAAMRASFAALVAQRGWPARVDAAVRADATWREGFRRMVDLQAALGMETKSVLPIDIMADFFVKEFRYHFLSADPARTTSDPRQTADVCFPWFLARVDAWAAFLRASFADVLAAKALGDDAAVYTDPACAFVAALLPAMQEKVQQTMGYAVQVHRQMEAAAAAAAAEAEEAAAANTETTAANATADTERKMIDTPPPPAGPSFLSSFIVQLLAFDDALRTRYGFDGGDSGGGPAAWPGLAGAVVDDERFGLWLAAEKAATLARYREVVGGESVLDYDYNGPGKTKPTLAAVRVMDLLRGVTGVYARVRPFRQRLRFLVDIQVTVLDAYDARLGDALEAYYALTGSAVARTLHGGVSREQRQQLEGTGALAALCRVYGSADHVARTLRAWEDEAFFVRLGGELEGRVGGGDKEKKGDGDGDGLFDETIANFARRRAAAQAFLVTALATANRKAFRPYVLRTQWAVAVASAEETDTDTNAAVTPELDEPLRVLDRNLAFLARALGTAVLRRTARAAVEQLQDLLWRDVLLAQRFTAAGAAQLARDVGAVAAVVARYVPASSAEAALGGLQEGVRLLALPVEEDANGGRITLQQASDRVFTDNAEARRLLQELGLTLVTTANARLILQRRVEVE